ncbi:MAG: Rho termination factor N-terminal domain-containing protein [Clostridia bacterium]|nr:Rho termination factor N-terminal domain-containing protein [Clostridia bacterium]
MTTLQLKELKLKELQKLAAECGIKKISTLKKGELIEKIEEQQDKKPSHADRRRRRRAGNSAGHQQ